MLSSFVQILHWKGGYLCIPPHTVSETARSLWHISHHFARSCFLQSRKKLLSLLLISRLAEQSEHVLLIALYTRLIERIHTKNVSAHAAGKLKGKTWGIIGLGAIGKKVAELATAFGCKVIYYSASGKKRSELYEQTDLDTLLANSDIVSCHAPLNDKTYHMMDYEQFCKMKPTAIFINVGRGPIVDEKGLAKALKKEKIGAAGLDVLEVEPMDPENPLCKLSESDRLLITPHIAWAAVEARTRLLQEVYKNLKAFQKGEKRNVCTG